MPDGAAHPCRRARIFVQIGRDAAGAAGPHGDRSSRLEVAVPPEHHFVAPGQHGERRRKRRAAHARPVDPCFRACDVALQTFGGFGYARETHIERLWREVRLYEIAPITQEMVLNYLAEHVLHLPKSY